MNKTSENQTYKSPLRKLVKFFEQSRDNWKNKCLEAKALLKKLKNKIDYLEKSRAQWKKKTTEFKEKITELEGELTEMKLKEERLKTELNELKKKVENNSEVAACESFQVVPARHHYSLLSIRLFLELVLKASISLRGAANSIEIINSVLQTKIPCPSWFSGRLWLLRLGYYKLMRPKKPGNDWVWIIDHTIQIGEPKCLVILGVRLRDLPKPGHCLKHENVEPITLLPVVKSNGQVVYEQLEEATKKTGVPKEIIGDYASDLKLGIEKFCQAHPETYHIYDIKHKTAAILKRELKNDEIFQAFTKLASQTKNQIQQTPLAFLAPRKQKTKARYMNVDTLIKWGKNILVFLDKQENKPDSKLSLEQIQEKLGWVKLFRQPLFEWEELFQVIRTTEHFVRNQGIYYNCSVELSFLLPFESQIERTNRVIFEILFFVNQESLKANSKRFLGSSEVLESILGKQKQLEKEQSKSGFTGLILGIAALVSTTTTEVVKKALESISTRDVLTWSQKTFGKSVQAKRIEVFASDKAE